MFTRKTRENLMRTADDDFNNLRDDLLNNEVIDAAIRMHSILNATAVKYSNDAIVELIPELTALFNKLDASLKVNEDINKNLTELSAEIELLKSSLEQEKEKRRTDFEESVSSEERADNEIMKLKTEIQDMRNNESKFKEELKNKTCIVDQLESDRKQLIKDLEEQNKEMQLLRERNKVETDFKRPKVTAKPKDTLCNKPAVEIKNRFLPLTTNRPELFSLPACKNIKVAAEVQNTPTSKLKMTPEKVQKIMIPRKKDKKKVIVLADSQGKQLHSYLHQLSDDYDVFVSSKPGAKLKTIIDEGKPIIKRLTKDDHLVILAGSNDFCPGGVGPLTVTQAVQNLLSVDVATNVIFHEVPFRYDAPELDADICYANQIISKQLKSYKGKQKLMIAQTNEYLKRWHFTRHGLHFNKSGKKMLSGGIVEMVSLLSSPKTAPVIESTCEHPGASSGPCRSSRPDGTQLPVTTPLPVTMTQSVKTSPFVTTPPPVTTTPSVTTPPPVSATPSVTAPQPVTTTRSVTTPPPMTTTPPVTTPPPVTTAPPVMTPPPPTAPRNETSPPNLSDYKDFPPLTPKPCIFVDESCNKYHSTPKSSSLFLGSSQL